MKRSEFECKIMNRALTDPAYRARLLKDPKAAVSEELNSIKPGTALPADVNVTVVQETPNQLYLVLPVDPKSVGDLAVKSAAPQGAGAAAAAVVAIDMVSQIVVSVHTTEALVVMVD